MAQFNDYMSSILQKVVQTRVDMIPNLLTDNELASDLYYDMLPPASRSVLEMAMADDVIGRYFCKDKSVTCLFEGAKLTFHCSIEVPTGPRSWDPAGALSSTQPRALALRNYIVKVRRIKEEVAQARSFIHLVIPAANTPGQLKRMWPEIIPLLPPSVHEVLGDMTRASRLAVDAPDLLNNEFIARRDHATRIATQAQFAPNPLPSHNVWPMN